MRTPRRACAVASDRDSVDEQALLEHSGNTDRNAAPSPGADRRSGAWRSRQGRLHDAPQWRQLADLRYLPRRRHQRSGDSPLGIRHHLKERRASGPIAALNRKADILTRTSARANRWSPLEKGRALRALSFDFGTDFVAGAISLTGRFRREGFTYQWPLNMCS